MAIWALGQLADELAAIAQGDAPPVRKVMLEHTIAYRGSDAPPADGGA
ncbi:hypothetical protein [Sphingomonas psychrotolerans]|nr:hypothetical protein [Sphingomonas psychrotolerans]